MSKNPVILDPVHPITITAETLDKAVSDFHHKWLEGERKTKAAIESFQVNLREKLYERLAHAFGVASAIMKLDSVDPKPLDDILKNVGFKRDARSGSNPWVTVVNLLFAIKVESGELVRSKSAYKYAAVFRHLSEQKIHFSKAAAYISSYTHSRHGSALLGMEAADRWVHKRTDEETEDERALSSEEQVDAMGVNAGAKKYLQNIEPFGSIDKSVLGSQPIENGQLFVLWGRFSDGEVKIYGELPQFSQKVSPFLNQLDQKFAKLAVQKAEGKKKSLFRLGPNVTIHNLPDRVQNAYSSQTVSDGK